MTGSWQTCLRPSAGRPSGRDDDLEALANAVKAEADAHAYKVKVEGEATADAIRARGLALRDSPLLIELTTAERWNGILPTTMLPGGSVPFLQVAKP